MGIPARYVSGYLHPKGKAKVGDTIDGQSHAWVQAWTGGWRNYDPTNDKEINEQYVSVGVGRDYADVSPLKGIYSGEGSTDLDVVVEITGWPDFNFRRERSVPLEFSPIVRAVRNVRHMEPVRRAARRVSPYFHLSAAKPVGGGCRQSLSARNPI